MSDRIHTEDYVENDEDVQIVSALADDIRDAVINYQVSALLRPLLWPAVEAMGLDNTATDHL